MSIEDSYRIQGEMTILEHRPIAHIFTSGYYFTYLQLIMNSQLRLLDDAFIYLFIYFLILNLLNITYLLCPRHLQITGSPVILLTGCKSTWRANKNCTIAQRFALSLFGTCFTYFFHYLTQITAF